MSKKIPQESVENLPEDLQALRIESSVSPPGNIIDFDSASKTMTTNNDIDITSISGIEPRNSALFTLVGTGTLTFVNCIGFVDQGEFTRINGQFDVIIFNVSDTVTPAYRIYDFARFQSLSLLATKANVLELDNTDAFTPDADYKPATKKYVDDNMGSGILQADSLLILSADLLTSNTTKLDVVPAQGATKAMRVIKAYGIIDYNSSAYATNTDLGIYVGSVLVGHTDNLINATADKRIDFIIDNTGVLGILNLPISIGVLTGNPTIGNSNIKIFVEYVITDENDLIFPPYVSLPNTIVNVSFRRYGVVVTDPEWNDISEPNIDAIVNLGTNINDKNGVITAIDIDITAAYSLVNVTGNPVQAEGDFISQAIDRGYKPIANGTSVMKLSGFAANEAVYIDQIWGRGAVLFGDQFIVKYNGVTKYSGASSDPNVVFHMGEKITADSNGEIIIETIALDYPLGTFGIIIKFDYS